MSHINGNEPGRPREVVDEYYMMTEADLDRSIQRIVASFRTVESYHTHDSRRSEGGFPDRVYAGPGGYLFRELKTRIGRVSEAQQKWIDILRAGGADADVWRPADLKSGRVARELARIARRPRPNGASLGGDMRL